MCTTCPLKPTEQAGKRDADAPPATERHAVAVGGSAQAVSESSLPQLISGSNTMLIRLQQDFS